MPSKTDTFQFPEVRVVEASAGSGKTYALAKRYVQLLLNPGLKEEEIPIRQILAITFTNKAAFEMKRRILDFLKTFAFGQFPQDQAKKFLQPVGISPQEAQKRSFAIMDSVIRHYNFFQVQTIDKFINALLAGCAFKINLTANFKIKTNSDEYLLYSLDNLLDLAPHNKDVRRVFEQFLHNYLYLENRTGWFPKKDILAITASLFAQYNTYGLPFHEGPFLQEDIIRKKRFIYELIHELRQDLPEGTDKRFVSAIDKFIKRAKDGYDVDSLSAYFLREFLPLRKGVDSTPALDKKWDKIRAQITELCEEEATSTFNPYVQVFNLVLSGMKQKTSKDDVLFLGELNKKAGELFDDDYVTVQELYYRLATRFRHYLIDEFQDTSRLQWHNLEKMVEEALSTGGSLFYVGDRKQAIYGFRGGEVELFDELKAAFKPFNVQVDYLTRNWRSSRSIVEFNNAVFSLPNLKSMIAQKQEYEEEKKNATVFFNETDIGEFANVFESSQQSFKQDAGEGFVNCEYMDIDKKEERDDETQRRVIKLVDDLLKRYCPRDICILTRSNAQIEQCTSWLLKAGHKVQSERTSNIKENSLIEELVAFLTFLNSPIDNNAFAVFLLSGIFPKMTGINQKEIQQFLFDCRLNTRERRDFYIYREFRRQYKEVWDTYFNEFFQSVGLYPLYETMVTLYSRFNLLEHFKEAQGFWMHFLELIKKSEEEYSDLGSFLEYYESLEGEELFINISQADAIRVITVHKSKGLQFPVVILPFLGMDIQVGAQNDNQQSYMLVRDDEGVNLVRHKKPYIKYSERLARIYRHEYKKAFLSELNNVYVALTRAEFEIHALIPKKMGTSHNLARFLIPEQMYRVGEKGSKDIQDSEGGKKAEGDVLQIPPAQYEDWIELLQDEFPQADSLLRRDERFYGELLHKMLAMVGNLAQDDLKETMTALKNVEGIKGIIDIESCVKDVEKLVTKKELQPFFAPKNARVRNECEVIDEKGVTKRIDRLVVGEKEVIVVDYKSSDAAREEHVAQVTEYKKIVTKLYKGKKVRGVLVYLDSLKHEEV